MPNFKHGFTTFSLHERGFTLIELLVVLSIIGLLIGAAVPVYDSFLVKSRDTKRISDLKVIQSALQQYYADEGRFPITVNTDEGSSLVGSTLSARKYLNKIPTDPKASSGVYPKYTYESFNRTGLVCNNTPSSLCIKYCLYAKLEGTPSELNPLSGCPARNNYNFAVVPN
ncbi:MAG: prepilin-type N-terminal cleavage/methylation domain-containing protein [Candidatus Daviesbacteria bacterium]|nr:prepilin-type N-terminal cleavage/methylation domain-containing protein [Candidatus Daviesbacteria bacterium]